MLPFILAAVLVVLGFYYVSRVPASRTVDAFEAEKLILGMPGLQIIDVRTRMEYDSGHLKGARLIPVQEIASRLGEIDKTKPVLVYCRSGHRSGVAMQAFIKQGFEEAVHMEGGILAWQAAGKPLA